ncbi:MAG: GBS Bsp-like repeat-containing protein [Lachnospiraceae bacterium]|nr:GBS Bsp-like repeat-containing protein [Lachnospiraceae bacterium]
MRRFLEKQDEKFYGRISWLIYIIKRILAIAIVGICVLLYQSVQWAWDNWSELSVDEIVYHLKAPLEGTGSNMILSYIVSCVFAAVAALVGITLLLKGLEHNNHIYRIIEIAAPVTALLAATTAVTYAWNELDLSSYLENQNTYVSFIDDNYVDPSSVEISFPQEKRNLIYIYLESMETTYADKESGGGFEDNYIPNLTKLSQENESFSGDSEQLNGGYALMNTTWTMGAMFGQSTGLPLTIPIEGSSMDTQDSFFPGVTAIGDILKDAGYQNTLLIGSKAVFGGRELFYREHGDYQICDYTYSLAEGEIPEGYYVWWGYEDQKLFDHAKKQLEEMSQSEEPFNLTILTADTHFEDGYYCKDCGNPYGDNQYANVIACSDKKVTSFIKWIQQQDFYENTTIVVTGDHPTMDKDFCDPVSKDYQRRVYTTYINAPIEPEQQSCRTYSTFDNFPTTVAALGADISGNRLGLGTNLFSSLPTLTEEYGVEEENSELSKKSAFMEKLTASINKNPTKLSEQEKMLQNQEDEQPEEDTATATVEVTPYDYKVGRFDIFISELSADEGFQAIRCAVWAEEDQSDLHWYDAQQLADGSYSLSVFASTFAFKTGVYQVHTYGVRPDGSQVLLNMSEGSIS